MNSGLSTRLAKIENSRRVVLVPLVVIYQAKAGISESQLARIDSARAIGQSVRIIKTVVVNGLQ